MKYAEHEATWKAHGYRPDYPQCFGCHEWPACPMGNLDLVEEDFTLTPFPVCAFCYALIVDGDKAAETWIVDMSSDTYLHLLAIHDKQEEIFAQMRARGTYRPMTERTSDGHFGFEFESPATRP